MSSKPPTGPDAAVLPGPSSAPNRGRTLPTLVELPAGLVGLPELRRFRVAPVDGSDVVELRCLDEESFAALATLLEAIAPDRLEELAELGLVEPGESVLVLLAAHGEPPVVTANLAGPIVVEPNGRGRQLVVENPAFPLRAPLGRA